MAMLKRGDVIANPISGETFHILDTATDTGGELLRFECLVRPNGRLAAPLYHIHPKQTEVFEILEGMIRVRQNGIQSKHRANERLEIAPGVAHDWENASPTEPLRFLVELRPALEWETLFESLFAMARDGLTKPDGSPPLLAMAHALHTYPDHFYLAKVPIWIQKQLFAALAPFAKLRGYKKAYRYFPERV
jgi:mannose-6-phosphate isomerase-like protein (cupin superfamily)